MSALGAPGGIDFCSSASIDDGTFGEATEGNMTITSSLGLQNRSTTRSSPSFKFGPRYPQASQLAMYKKDHEGCDAGPGSYGGHARVGAKSPTSRHKSPPRFSMSTERNTARARSPGAGRPVFRSMTSWTPGPGAHDPYDREMKHQFGFTNLSTIRSSAKSSFPKEKNSEKWGRAGSYTKVEQYKLDSAYGPIFSDRPGSTTPGSTLSRQPSSRMASAPSFGFSKSKTTRSQDPRSWSRRSAASLVYS